MYLPQAHGAIDLREPGTNFGVGSSSGGAFQAWGTLDDIVIRKDVWTAAKFAEVFAQGRGLGERRNRWTSMVLVNPNFDPVWTVGNNYNLTLQMKEKLS